MSKKHRNHPLYLLVAALGVLFTVSACAYCVMSFRAARGGEAYMATERDAGLMRLMRERGGTILAVEIATLAVASVAAMASDRRGVASRDESLSRRDESAESPLEPPSTAT